MQDRAAELMSVPVFAGRPRPELRVLAQHMDELPVEAGQVLIEKGRSNSTFFVLLDGEVEVRMSDRRRRRLGAGDFFGEISMENMRPATATVVARAPGRALVMGRAQYRAVLASAPVRARLLSAISARLEADRRPRTVPVVAEKVEAVSPGKESLSSVLAAGAGRLGRWLWPRYMIEVYRPYCPGCYGPGRCTTHRQTLDWRAGF